ncbi:hypothetical protein NLO98_13195 [Pseudomonas syringae]|nr:hypothetical protein [Pseudomonas syringae]
MSLRIRDELPVYSKFFRTEYDEQYNVGKLGAHYSVLSFPLVKDSEKFQLQRLAVIWDADHDTRVINILEAGFFAGLTRPVVFIAEHKGHVSIITNGDINQSERDTQTRVWQRISDDVIEDDNFTVEVILEKDFIAAQVRGLQKMFETYFNYIDDAWGIGPCPYNRVKAHNRRPSLSLSRKEW